MSYDTTETSDHDMQTLSVEGDKIMYAAAIKLADSMNEYSRPKFIEWTELDEWELHESALEIFEAMRPDGVADDHSASDTEVRYTVYETVVHHLCRVHGWGYDCGRLSA